jgi:hypothetical protein
MCSGACVDYSTFLDTKRHLGAWGGFTPLWMPDFLFDFQAVVTEWAIRKGCAAIFADCGLGKTPMQLVWAENVVRQTNKRVLILTPLAVSAQTLAEAEKFGIQARRSRAGELHAGITVTNYERLHYFNPADFVGVVADESSILKSFDGVRRAEVTEFMRRMPYRLLATATAAPNDYIELGTSSEALGQLGHTDMLGRFFKNDQHTIRPMRYTGFGNPRGRPPGGEHTDKWRFKGHAEGPFWRWVASWARALRRPSDLGFADGAFRLPPLIEREHMIEAIRPPADRLFTMPAVGLQEQRDERRRTIAERCDRAAALVADTKAPALVWCHLNDEGDRLAEVIPDAVQISGDDDDDAKEEAFAAFVRGQVRVLVTKPKIGAWGLNFQHCAHVTMFPSHSFEQYYQGVRRCWRFGQTRPVLVDVITTEGERNVLKNLQRKAAAADAMFSSLVAAMTHAETISPSLAYTITTERPPWLS